MDVILSIVGSEMRAVRQEVDQKLKSVPEKPRPMSPTSEARDVQARRSLWPWPFLMEKPLAGAGGEGEASPRQSTAEPGLENSIE